MKTTKNKSYKNDWMNKLKKALGVMQHFTSPSMSL